MIVYAGALVGGGVLLLSSLVMGHHDGDLGGHDVAHPGGVHDGHHDPGSSLFLPFLSLRFWTFGATFFGLTGVLLEGLALAPPATALAVSSALGVGCGTTAAIVLRSISRIEVTSHVTDLACVGQKAEVLLDVGPSLPGRVRVAVRGDLLDLPAKTTGTETFTRGGQVLILDVQEGEATVGPAGASPA